MADANLGALDTLTDEYLRAMQANANRLIIMVVLVLAAVFALAGFGIWYFWPTPIPVVGQPTLLPPVAAAKREERVPTPSAPPKAYKPQAKVKLALPEEVKKDNTVAALVTGHLDAEERPYSLVATLNTQTGESQVYATAEPLPWFDRSRHGELVLGFYQKTDGQVLRLSGRQDILRIKQAFLDVRANVDSDGDAAVGLNLGYRW